MRILLLTPWLDHEPSSKGLIFAQELQECGHDVQVITGFRNYPGGKADDRYRVRPIRREVHGGVAVVRVPFYPGHDNSAIHRIMIFLSFALRATFAALVVRRPDVAYVHHPPAMTGLPALALKTIRGVPFVYDVEDLWPDTLAASGTIANTSVPGAAGRRMRRICRAAARVVVRADGTRDAISSRGTPPDKITVLHNRADDGLNPFLRVLDQARLARPRFSLAKRAVDIIASSVALVVLGAPMAILSILVRQKLGSPVIFRQTRPGRHGEPFEMIKFRSMTDARDESGNLLSDHERLTPFGARLRSSSLDELPEFWNVFKGQMSLIGPRPLLARYTPYYTDEERLRLLVKPGISGWAQVNGRNASPWDERLGMDAWYVRNRSLRLDSRIVFMTLTRVLRKTGVVVDSTSAIRDFDDERRDRMGVT